jgi:hypothetical protein
MSHLVSRTSTSTSVHAEGQAPATPPPSSPDSNGAIVETASAEGEVVHSVHAAQAAGVTPQSATSSDLDASTVVHPMDSADIECMLNAWTAAQTGADVNLSDATCFEHYFSNEVCDSEPLTIDFSKAPKYKFKAPVEDANTPCRGSNLKAVCEHSRCVRPFPLIPSPPPLILPPARHPCLTIVFTMRTY